MNEVYTISGPPVDEVEVLGAISPLDTQCAQKVKVLVVAGGASVVGGVGVGLFGTYKLLKGHGAAGAVGLLGAAALWIAGAALVRTAALGFQKCRTPAIHASRLSASSPRFASSTKAWMETA